MLADLWHSIGLLCATFGFSAAIGAGLVCGIRLAAFVWPIDANVTIHHKQPTPEAPRDPS